MQQYAKLNDDGSLTTSLAKTDGHVTSLIDRGFLPREVEAQPTVELSEFQRYEVVHTQYEDRIVTSFVVVDNDPELIAKEIELLTNTLTLSDYKVIKNHEYIDAGLEPYYDPLALYNEREPLRERIRQLEMIIT